jgi:hypothetical protein
MIISTKISRQRQLLRVIRRRLESTSSIKTKGTADVGSKSNGDDKLQYIPPHAQRKHYGNNARRFRLILGISAGTSERTEALCSAFNNRNCSRRV